MGNILSRIQEIASNEGITIGALERQIGASKGVLSRAINNGTDIQSKWVQTIVENYPQYSARWLMIGVGSMLENNADKQIQGEANDDQKKHIAVPVVPAFKGADFLIPVKGSSMYPKYSSGDIVACQRVPMSDLFFQWNKVYVIDTNQGALIKRIKPGSDKDHVLIVSDNEKYDPFELPYSAIHAVALVIGVIRLE